MTHKIDGITVEQLKDAYQIAAEVVSRHGDPYLPVFCRLHAEMEKLKQSDDKKTLAINIAALNIKSDSKK